MPQIFLKLPRNFEGNFEVIPDGKDLAVLKAQDGMLLRYKRSFLCFWTPHPWGKSL